MAKRRKAPFTKLDPCKIKIERLKKLSPEKLMSLWGRMNRSKFGRSRAGSALVGWLANYATAKSVREKGISYYAEDPVRQRRHAIRVYLGISRRLEREFKLARKKSCRV